MDRKGILLIFAASFGYAFLPILTKSLYDTGLEPLDVVTWRFIFAAPGIWLLVFALSNRQNAVPLTSVARLSVLGMGFMFAFLAMLAFFSLERIPASLFIVLAYAYPAFVALLSLFTGEYLPLRGWFALGLTLVGVVLTVPSLSSGLGGGDTLGIVLALSNGMFYAVYLVISRRMLRGYPDQLRAGAFSITGALFVLLAVALFNGLQAPTTLESWASVLGLGFICTVLPIPCIYAGLKRLGAPRASIVAMLEPVLVLLLSFVLLGETMTAVQLVGGALIVSSTIILQLNRQSHSPMPQSDDRVISSVEPLPVADITLETIAPSNLIAEG